MNYFEHHIGDYLKDTAHLSLLEHGIYRRLMDVYYTHEKALPEDPCRLIGARSKEEREATQTVLAEFFDLVGAEWHHKRCDEEIARYRGKQDKARASAEARWGKSDRNANASPEHPPSADAPSMRAHSEGNATRARPQSPDTRPNTVAPIGAPERRKASRLPSDWEPAEESSDFGKSLGLSLGQVVAELAKFRDFWAGKAGKDGTKLDWQATWRNWLRSAAERTPRSSQQTAESFRERDERLARERYEEATGKRRPMPATEILQEVIDVTPRRLG